MQSRTFRRSLVVAALMVAAIGLGASAATAKSSAVQVSLAGTGAPQTGDFTPSGSGDVTDEEFAGEADDEDQPDPYGGNIIDRSLSAGGAAAGVPTSTGKKAKSDPQFNFGFEGLNFYQQRYARGGNQFSVEPPDQAM